MRRLGKILVVDDQYGVRRLLVETFRAEQHEAEMAANGVEALRLFTVFEPDLILMDLKMPGLNGIETLKKIRDLDSQVAVILMTAYYGDLKNMEKAKEDLGIHRYISKPFDLFEVREFVREIFKSAGMASKDRQQQKIG